MSAADGAANGAADLWTLWTLGPSTPDTHRLAASLMAQEAQSRSAYKRPREVV